MPGDISKRRIYINVHVKLIFTFVLPGKASSYIKSRTKTLTLIIKDTILTIGSWIWDVLHPHIEEVEDAVQGAYVDSVIEDDPNREVNFLQACSNGDKHCMRQILVRVDVNFTEEGSGNTGDNSNALNYSLIHVP